MIHPSAVIHPNTSIHPSVVIEPFCVIGSDHGHLSLGQGSVIRSHSIIEGGSQIGEQLETGHHALIRTGNVIGFNLRLGTQSRLEGGARIGDYVRIHGNVEMTKADLRHFARVYADTTIADNLLPPSDVNELAVLDEGSVVCLNSVVLAGVRLGIGSFVGAQTVVSRDVPDATALVGGKLKPVNQLTWKGYSYPWTGYYADAYPSSARSRIAVLHDRIMRALEDGNAG